MIDPNSLATVAMPPAAREAILRARQGPGPDLEQRRWRWGLYVGIWTLVGVIFVGPIVARCLAENTPIPWPQVASELLGWYLWGLLFPLIWRLSRTFPFERDKLASRIPINLAIGLIITVVYLLLSLVKEEIVESLLAGQWSFDRFELLPGYLFVGIEYYLAIYFAIVAVIHAVSFYGKYRDRELQASRLEAQLALAHLEVLKTQLHPHFLFNALNAISSLMHSDVDAADRMISKLSDLLRLSLDNDHRLQVPLRDEIEFLNRYLAIEQIRFRDRLDVEMDIDQDCWAAMVPRLILQPLVENSIRHGISMLSAAGRIAVRARLEGERLRLEVWDDGPGLPQGNQPMREGVGLANTRARLEQTYGEDHRFELFNADTGGLTVHIEMPFEAARHETGRRETGRREKRQTQTRTQRPRTDKGRIEKTLVATS